jgi:hypothetical protein
MVETDSEEDRHLMSVAHTMWSGKTARAGVSFFSSPNLTWLGVLPSRWHGHYLSQP